MSVSLWSIFWSLVMVLVMGVIVIGRPEGEPRIPTITALLVILILSSISVSCQREKSYSNGYKDGHLKGFSIGLTRGHEPLSADSLKPGKEYYVIWMGPNE